MASFRNWSEEPRQAPRQPSRRDEEERYWRQRDEQQRRQQEAEKKAKEEATRKALDVKSETAYPSLGGPRPKATNLGKNSFAALANEPAPKPTNAYARLASEWKKEEDTAREAERLRNLRKQQERLSTDGVFIYRPKERGYGGYEEPEEEPRAKTDTAGWAEVSHNRYKGKREMTVDEMDEMCEEMEDEEDGRGMNEHLFEVSHRHDHH